jgi:hypothetical protein
MISIRIVTSGFTVARTRRTPMTDISPPEPRDSELETLHAFIV